MCTGAKSHDHMNSCPNIKSDAAELMILVLKASLEGLEKQAGCYKQARALMYACVHVLNA